MTKRRKIPERHNRSAEQTTDYVLKDANDINVVVGPLLWQPSDGTAAKVYSREWGVSVSPAYHASQRKHLG